jgi:hypothetical protein
MTLLVKDGQKYDQDAHYVFTGPVSSSRVKSPALARLHSIHPAGYFITKGGEWWNHCMAVDGEGFGTITDAQ